MNWEWEWTGNGSGLGMGVVWEWEWTGNGSGLGMGVDWEWEWTGNGSGLGMGVNVCTRVNATVNHTPDGYEVVINAPVTTKTSWQQDGSYMPAKQDYLENFTSHKANY